MLSSRSKSLRLAIAGAALVLAGGIGLAVAATSAHGAGTQTGEDLKFNQQSQIPLTATQFASHAQDCFPTIPRSEDGWHFVFPHGTFDTLTATFRVNEEEITPSTIFTHSDMHAFVGTPPGAVLVRVTATGTFPGEAEEFFNLSHTCPATETPTPTPTPTCTETPTEEPTTPTPTETEEPTTTPPTSPTETEEPTRPAVAAPPPSPVGTCFGVTG